MSGARSGLGRLHAWLQAQGGSSRALERHCLGGARLGLGTYLGVERKLVGRLEHLPLGRVLVPTGGAATSVGQVAH